MASTHSKISFLLFSICLFSFIAGAWASDVPIITHDLHHAGIAVEPSYKTKKTGGNPHKSGPSPVSSPTVCDKFKSCPEKSTCCCVYGSSKSCNAWGCCALEGAVCCEDRNSCCPREFPVCNVKAGTCSASKGSPLGVMAMKRVLAKPAGSFAKKGITSGA